MISTTVTAMVPPETGVPGVRDGLSIALAAAGEFLNRVSGPATRLPVEVDVCSLTASVSYVEGPRVRAQLSSPAATVDVAVWASVSGVGMVTVHRYRSSPDRAEVSVLIPTSVGVPVEVWTGDEWATVYELLPAAGRALVPGESVDVPAAAILSYHAVTQLTATQDVAVGGAA